MEQDGMREGKTPIGATRPKTPIGAEHRGAGLHQRSHLLRQCPLYTALKDKYSHVTQEGSDCFQCEKNMRSSTYLQHICLKLTREVRILDRETFIETSVNIHCKSRGNTEIPIGPYFA